jgi:hypothetical protein
MASNFPPISNGTIITTTQENLALKNEWVEGVKEKCRWGVRGEVVNYSSGHGLCYEVKHDDGTTAWYDPSEFHICMLAVLHQVEKALPDLLRDESIWKSVDVTYHPELSGYGHRSGTTGSICTRSTRAVRERRYSILTPGHQQ